MGADDRVPARQAVLHLRRPRHREEQQRRHVPPHRHARAHQAQGRRHVLGSVSELPREIGSSEFAKDFAPTRSSCTRGTTGRCRSG
jgi:hypothetical protein